MAVASPSTSSTASHSIPESHEPSATQSSNKTTPIDPFSINVTSWEEWSAALLPTPPLPTSVSFPTPPKVDLFSKSPLQFTPCPGPISLKNSRKTPRQESPGPIDLFDMKPYQRPQLPKSDGTEEVFFVAGPQLSGRTPANDTEELQFDWPSEEIKRACEELFPGSKEWTLPALNWIPPEESNNGNKGEPMQDIQKH